MNQTADACDATLHEGYKKRTLDLLRHRCLIELLTICTQKQDDAVMN